MGVVCGRSAAGSASPCQGEGRGFEPRRPLGARPARPHLGGVAERRGSGLQSRPHGFESRLHLGAAPTQGRLAQWESTSLTRKGSLVQSQYRPRTFPHVSAHSRPRHLRSTSLPRRSWRWGRPTVAPRNASRVTLLATLRALLRAGPWPGIMSTPTVPPVGTRAEFPPVKPGTRPTRPRRAQGRRSGADKPLPRGW